MTITFSNDAPNRAAAYALRQAVFVEERAIPAAVEFDDKDTDERLYGVLYLKPDLPVADVAVGTASRPDDALWSGLYP